MLPCLALQIMCLRVHLVDSAPLIQALTLTGWPSSCQPRNWWFSVHNLDCRVTVSDLRAGPDADRRPVNCEEPDPVEEKKWLISRRGIISSGSKTVLVSVGSFLNAHKGAACPSGPFWLKRL